MKPNASTFATTLVVVALISGCANNRITSSDPDDLYYSASERRVANENEFNKVEETSGKEFMTEESTAGNYFSPGRVKNDSDVNPRSEEAFAQQGEANSATESTEGAQTVNHFYGTTNYYEGEYYDDSYSTQFRRFDQSNFGLGFGYYDPFWNYGWGMGYPYSGLSFGYSSWYGWNWGISAGWGWGGWYSGFPYRSYYGYNCWDPWYGYGWNLGWGYPYYGYGWNQPGYAYWNGYNDGIAAGGIHRTQTRPIGNGRRSLVAQNGTIVPRSSDRGVQSRTQTSAEQRSSLVATTTESTNQGVKAITPRAENGAQTTNVSRSTVVGSSASVYQASTSPVRLSSEDANPRSTVAAVKYQSSVDRNSYRADKYTQANLVRTDRPESTSNNSVQRSTQEYNRGAHEQTLNSGRVKYSGYSRTTRDPQSGQAVTTTSRNPNTSTVQGTQPVRSNNVKNGQRHYERPRSEQTGKPSSTAVRSVNPQSAPRPASNASGRTPVPAKQAPSMNREVKPATHTPPSNRMNSAPSRTSAPSNNHSAPSRSGGGVSSPSRSRR